MYNTVYFIIAVIVCWIIYRLTKTIVLHNIFPTNSGISYYGNKAELKEILSKRECYHARIYRYKPPAGAYTFCPGVYHKGMYRLEFWPRQKYVVGGDPDNQG